jgi:hypothetical protein
MSTTLNLKYRGSKKLITIFLDFNHKVPPFTVGPLTPDRSLGPHESTHRPIQFFFRHFVLTSEIARGQTRLTSEFFRDEQITTY